MVMKKVQATGEPLVITNRGNPMVRMIREEPTAPTPYFFGVSKGQATLLGDIMAPLDEPWEAYDGILPD
jgi:antitoxin (DNA-binding transcriptional repressor) of toxin-antitoxin stability system